MSKILRLAIYFSALALVLASCSDDEEEPNNMVIITGLDFTISADQSSPNIVTITPSAANAETYSIDFGDPNSTSDVFSSNGASVSYTYPEENATYTISVVASAQNANDVSVTKSHTVMIADTNNPNDNAELEGSWTMAPSAGALGVGPGRGDVSWWSSGAGDVSARDCFFDDEYVFNADGSFQNILGDNTWIEPWQGNDPEGCSAPVAPHDGTASATFEYLASEGTLKISGAGAFLGLAKVFNGGELAAPSEAKDEIIYQATLSDDKNSLLIEIEIAGGGWWTFNLIRKGTNTGGGDGCQSSQGVVGVWKMAPEAGALAVGPNRGSSEWWSNAGGDVSTRDCFFDDEYIFNEDGSFQNVLGDNTWMEPWQGIDPEGCATPLAPHDGSAQATYSYDDSAGTVTLTGKGAFLGLAKVVNGAELTSPSDAPDEVIYEVSFSEDNCTMIVEIDFGGGWWTYRLARQ